MFTLKPLVQPRLGGRLTNLHLDTIRAQAELVLAPVTVTRHFAGLSGSGASRTRLAVS